jgi:8-amino-7-oxononanoate synthase
VIDFTSALYLGMRHRHASLAPWSSLTTGVPVALAEPAAARGVARAIAKLQGCEAAVLMTSTLHAFWDLFGMIGRDLELLVDASLYAVGRAGVERARGRGVPVRVVPHYDEEALRSAVTQSARRGRRPVLVCDGLCVDCGRVAPLRRAEPLLEAHGGHAIVDDTQGLGVVGGAPSARRWYGVGGGGALTHQGASQSDAIVVTSLAKAFGVPISAVSGRLAAIRGYKARSESRLHSSPPSLAHLAAAARALRINRAVGEYLRGRLFDNILRFRRRASAAGVPLDRTMFPIQTVAAPVDGDALHRALLQRGVATVLRAAGCPSQPRASFVVTASHTTTQIEEAVGHLALAIEHCPRKPTEDFADVDHKRRVYASAAPLPHTTRGAADLAIL